MVHGSHAPRCVVPVASNPTIRVRSILPLQPGLYKGLRLEEPRRCRPSYGELSPYRTEMNKFICQPIYTHQLNKLQWILMPVALLLSNFNQLLCNSTVLLSITRKLPIHLVNFTTYLRTLITLTGYILIHYRS